MFCVLKAASMILASSKYCDSDSKKKIIGIEHQKVSRHVSIEATL